jgi:hypothetical protein
MPLCVVVVVVGGGGPRMEADREREKEYKGGSGADIDCGLEHVETNFQVWDMNNCRLVLQTGSDGTTTGLYCHPTLIINHHYLLFLKSGHDKLVAEHTL